MATEVHLDAGIFTDNKPKLEERCVAANISIHPGLRASELKAKLCLAMLGAPVELEEEVRSVVEMNISGMKSWAETNLNLCIESGRKADIVEVIISALVDRGPQSADIDDAMSIATRLTSLHSPSISGYTRPTVADFDLRHHEETAGQPFHPATMWTSSAAATTLRQSVDLERAEMPGTTSSAGKDAHTKSTTRDANPEKAPSVIDASNTKRFTYRDTELGTKFATGMERGVSRDTRVNLWDTQTKKRKASPSADVYNEDKFREALANAVIAVLQEHSIKGSKYRDEDYVDRLVLLQEKYEKLSLEHEALDYDRDKLSQMVSSQKAELEKVKQALQDTKAAWESDKKAQAKISDDVKTVKRLVSDFRGERQVQEKKLDTFLDSIDNALEAYFNQPRDHTV